MRYPTADDEIAKECIMDWFKDQYEDEEDARKSVKQMLAIKELWERGFRWTDI